MSILNLIPIWFALALIIPIVWAVSGAYRRAKVARTVLCPQANQSAVIALDPRDAALMHILGNPARKIQRCQYWPERRDCACECLQGIEP